MSASPVLRVAFRPPRGRAHPRPKWVTSQDLASQCKRSTAARRARRGASLVRVRALDFAQRTRRSLSAAGRGERGGSPSAQRVLHAANGVADFPADLVGLPLAFELLV